MELILNNNNIPQKENSDIKNISIETWRTNPTIDTEVLEFTPQIEKQGTISHISYEKRKYLTIITYQKSLTPKSGIEIRLNIKEDGTIENGYVDFYTIKKSTTKRNGHYRLEFNQNNFELYTDLSRNCNYRYLLSNYQIEGNITPKDLSMVISRMINIIEKYVKKHDKQRIIGKNSNFLTIEGILNFEKYLLQIIKDILENGNLTSEERNILSGFLKRYEENKQEQLKRVREKKEASTNN